MAKRPHGPIGAKIFPHDGRKIRPAVSGSPTKARTVQRIALQASREYRSPTVKSASACGFELMKDSGHKRQKQRFFERVFLPEATSAPPRAGPYAWLCVAMRAQVAP